MSKAIKTKEQDSRNSERHVAVVTGGTSRIGAEICHALASTGYDVAFFFHTARETAKQLVVQLSKQHGTRNTCYTVDLSLAWMVESAISRVANRYGRIDLLVNNASAFEPTPLPFRVRELIKWRSLFDATFWGTLYCCNSVLPFMVNQSRGHIINIADVYADIPLPGYGAYCIAKSAILALTRQLAVEYAPRIRVNAVCPGPITPPIGRENNNQAFKFTLLQCWGGAKSVSKAVSYLDANQFVTGEILTVDGGKRYVGVQR